MPQSLSLFQKRASLARNGWVCVGLFKLLQCVAVCCSVLQCVTVYCSGYGATRNDQICAGFLSMVAECCSVLQWVAECCSVLQWIWGSKKCICTHTLTYVNVSVLQIVALCCIVLQWVAECCSVLQWLCGALMAKFVQGLCGLLDCAALHCIVLHCVALFCRVLQCITIDIGWQEMLSYHSCSQ